MNQPVSAPRVVVGIVTRDRVSIVRKAIDSALAQSYPGLQVWVLNDHSTDETSRIAAEYPGVVFIESPIAQGCIAARKRLMEQVEADYFVSLDDDAWFRTSDEIAVAVRNLEENPKVGAIAFDILAPDNSEPHERRPAQDVAMFIGCGHVLRMSAFRRAQGYATSPGTYGSEEKDLALRLMDAGYRIVKLPGVHVWHDKTNVARDQPVQHRSGVCNDLGMTLRRAPFFVLPAAMLAKFYRHYRFSRRHGLEEPFWEGLQLFFESIPELWKTRHPVRLSTLREFVKLTRKQTSPLS